MKHITKNKLTAKQRATVLLAVTFALLLAICIPVAHYLINRNTVGTQIFEQPEILEGEARQGGYTLAYPAINKKDQIISISVNNAHPDFGNFGFAKLAGEKQYTMYYIDKKGETHVYYPGICEEDDAFNYSELYAIETSDGFSYYTMLDYLCLALQTAYFSDRIPLSEDEGEKAAQLKEYGLDKASVSNVVFKYVNEEGNEVQRTVRIGSKNVSESGYYFMVDDRQYVYAASNTYYDYATAAFTTFINASIVAEGLPEDIGTAPIYTPGYHQWKNKLHETDGEAVDPGSIVITYTDVFFSTLEDGENGDGYERTGYKFNSFDLGKYSGEADYASLIKVLRSLKIGELQRERTVTARSGKNYFLFGKGATSLKYVYTISSVESILTDGEDIVEYGAIAGNGHDLIRVSYTYTVDGKVEVPHVAHAVLDLTSSYIPTEARDALRAAPVGVTLAGGGISFTVDYTPSTAPAQKTGYVITEIISILDKDGKNQKKVAANSTVAYRYSVIIDGEEFAVDNSYVLDLSTVTEGTDLAIKNALIGKGVSKDLNLTFDSYATVYYEIFSPLTTYVISAVDSFITREPVVAFRFLNSTDRDPYYGGSIYENLLEDERRLYGLENNNCDEVISFIGGLSNETTSGTGGGLVGDKVVAVGLDPSVLKGDAIPGFPSYLKERGGLYANIIEFKLPRTIVPYDPETGEESSSDRLDNVTYLSLITFTLYISDTDPVTNKRYVASDLYDTVVTVDAEDFDFLDKDFKSFWAKRKPILMDVKYLNSLEIEFNMKDLEGKYHFDVEHLTNKDGETLSVFVTHDEKAKGNKLVDLIKQEGYSGISLTEFYNYYYPDKADQTQFAPSSLGTEYFTSMFLILFYVEYVDLMPEEDKAAALSPDKMLFRLTIELSSSAYGYVYEFYRADDRRVVVKIFQADENGNPKTESISDFYISTFAFKKIINSCLGLLNAERLSYDDSDIVS
ncbi:MAG: DUF4340 domain-containing protein [Clostridia bacterium]|nr:DUF4340 domain-containing protein [Clostridia bacterium]